MASGTGGGFPIGVWLLCVTALVSVVIAGFNTFNTGNGIAYTPATYLALASTALLLIGAVVLALGTGLPRWVVVVFAVLTLLDILGTAFAAYLMEAGILLGAMAVAGIAWLVYVAVDPDRGRWPRPLARQGA